MKLPPKKTLDKLKKLAWQYHTLREQVEIAYLDPIYKPNAIADLKELRDFCKSFSVEYASVDYEGRPTTCTSEIFGHHVFETTRRISILEKNQNLK